MGKVIAGRLIALDAHVFAVGRDIESLPSTSGQKLTKVTVDIGDWDETYNKILEMGPVHGLVNNAGVAHIEPFLDTTQHGWDEYEYGDFLFNGGEWKFRAITIFYKVNSNFLQKLTS